MSSPQADFLARWMPSSTRAGVILNPCPELAGSLRHIPAAGSIPLEPDDSFASDFAALPASADSSCLGVDRFTPAPGGESAGTDRPANGSCSVSTRMSRGQADSLCEMAGNTLDLPLMMKLEQLRKWQQQMQEQLKAHQLEELLRLQQDQLLGMVNESQHCTGDFSEMSEAEWEEDSYHQENPRGQVSKCVLKQEEQLSGGQKQLPRGEWTSRGEDEERSVETRFCDDTKKPRGDVDITEGSRHKDEDFNDRPIKPGVGGQKQTFEELLEEQLRLEEQRLKSAEKQQCQDGVQLVQAIPKRAFLKRGQGLSRFTNNHKGDLPKMERNKDSKPQPQAKVISRSNSEPASVQKSGMNSVQRVPVQRKTATLNKENQLRGVSLTPHTIRIESKIARTNVLGNLQRQNTLQTDLDGRQTKQRQLGQGKEPKNRRVGPFTQIVRKPEVHNIQPNPVTKQVGMLGESEKAEHDPAQDKSSRVESAEESRGSQGGNPQDSFELLFQEKLHGWEQDRQLESMELGEFELLEQAAEELSFSSNSSFVMKVLHMDQQHRQMQAARGLHHRRLSSTPIKSPPRDVLRRSSSVGVAHQSSSVNSEAFVKRREDTFQNKESTEVKEGPDTGNEVESDSSEPEDQDVMQSRLCFPEQSKPPYDKRSYQDEDSCDDCESDSDLSRTLTEDRDGRQRIVVFDDDDTWNDPEDTAAGSPGDGTGVGAVSKATASGAPPPEKTLLGKVAVGKAVEPNPVTVTGAANVEPDPPPASQLMTRLFPSLRPRTQNAPVPPLPPPPAVSHSSVQETGQQIQSRQLRERLVELEIEIERFKKENAALAKLRQENEKIQENLRKERLEFEQMKMEEMAKFEEYKKEENKKLQKERKLSEKHTSAARAIPDKKEREEIQVLKLQVSSLQEELRRKESRWASVHSRQRQQIDSLSQENSSFRDEISTLEKLRISALKKNPLGAEKDRPSVSAVAKGVKFANPLDFSSSSSPPQSSSRDNSQSRAAGIKSSLRRPSGSAISSSSKRDPPNTCSDTCEEPEAIWDITTHPDGKTEKVLPGGDRLVVFPNGTEKEVSADGLTVKVTFFNGDTKQITADQRVIYYYAEARTTHVTYPDGMEVLHFPNNQTEKHFPDGRKEITFPDQTVKNLLPDGREESVLTDGTIIQVNPDGTKEILFNTGQKEIHTADYKRREYPDGTTKTVYSDGRQETRYPNGRLRIKDKDGNVIVDNRV